MNWGRGPISDAVGAFRVFIVIQTLQETALRLSRVEMFQQELEALAVPFKIVVKKVASGDEAAPSASSPIAAVSVTFFRSKRPFRKFQVTFQITAGYPFAHMAFSCRWSIGKANNTQLAQVVQDVPPGFDFLTRVCAAVRMKMCS